MTGTVVDNFGDPVIGANVIVKGTTIGNITDVNGTFTVENVPDDAVLQISYIGFKTLEVPVKGQTTFNITLQEDTENLQEVVVVGYGTQKMKNVTGAIETLSTDEIKDLSVGSLGDALSGMMSGLHVSSGGGRPGSTPSLQIRQSSINTSVTPASTRGGDADPSPLYVIDDFISTEEAFNNLDVSEVESITVLKLSLIHI